MVLDTSSRMSEFAAYRGITSYDDLHRWSTADLESFWSAVAQWADVEWHTPPSAVLPSEVMPGADWFPGSTLNFAQHALRAASRQPDRAAVLAYSEARGSLSLTWSDLSAQVCACAQGLRRLGVGPGDSVVGYLPNIPETVVAFLASASLGAVWACCAPEFGPAAAVDRLGQLRPKVLLTVDGYRYAGRRFERHQENRLLAAGMSSVQSVVEVPLLGRGDGWASLLRERTSEAQWTSVPFAHPLYVLFSSGTTGAPKAIVHSHGGITLEHLKVFALHHDLGADDRLFWYTTTSWMMWNYLVSALLVGTSIVLYDGSPMYPNIHHLWRIRAETGSTAFGASAGFHDASKAADVRPRTGELRWIGSTGSPLSKGTAEWLEVTTGVPVASISGGTDICTALVGAAPMVTAPPGRIGCRMLGCDVHAFDEEGNPCRDGEMGELVVTKPMPSMPVGFLDDPDGVRYRAAYFERFQGIWRHGDWATFHDDGSCEISGRSDATLNRGGVRLGSSELYTVVESMPAVVDSLVVHLDETAGGQLLLFIVLADGQVLDTSLREQIRHRVRTDLSPRHVPDAVLAVGAIPRTRTGKKVEVPVKRILEGAEVQAVTSIGALEDASSLHELIDAALQHAREESE